MKSDSHAKYREFVMQIQSNGAISDEDLSHLAAAQESLLLAAEEAAAIEREILGDSKERLSSRRGATARQLEDESDGQNRHLGSGLGSSNGGVKVPRVPEVQDVPTLSDARMLAPPSTPGFGVTIRDGVPVGEQGPSVGGPLEVGSLIADRFEVLAVLGQGGMGQVYKVRDTKLGADRAMKVIASHLAHRPEVLARFRDEVITSQMLAHPHIVRVYEYEEDRARQLHFFTMEYVAGQTLRDWLNGRRRAQRPVTLEEFQQIAQALCSALAYAHEMTIHRDVKPENVLVSGDLGLIKLTDFGIARALGTDRVYVTSGTLGTPFYMAPEQETGEEVDRRADLYSLGVMFYEMLAGRQPRGTYRSLSEIRSDVSRALDLVIARAMAQDSDERWSSAQELGQAVRHPDQMGTAELRESGPVWQGDDQRVLRHLVDWYCGRKAEPATPQEIRHLHEEWTAGHADRVAGVQASVLLRLSDRARRLAADRLLWEEACRENTEASYDRYLKAEGLGTYREVASQKLMELIDARIATEKREARLWQEAREADTIEAYEGYLRESPLRLETKAAERRLRELREERAWATATKLHTIEQYERYIREGPLLKYKDEANRRIYDLRYPGEQQAWEQLQASPNLRAVRVFLERYPASPIYDDVVAIGRGIRRRRKRLVVVMATVLCAAVLATCWVDELRTYLRAPSDGRTAGLPARLDEGMIVHYRFEGDVRDSSATQNHGIASNGLRFGSGRVGWAAKFDGARDSVTLTRPLVLGAKDYTIAFWMKSTDTGNYIIHSWAPNNARTPGNDSESLIVSVGQSPAVLLLYQSGEGNVQAAIPGHLVVDGTWHHVAFIRRKDGMVVKAYLDGRPVASAPFRVRPETTPVQTRIGGSAGEPIYNPNAGYAGWLDELRIYDRPLYETEIAALAN